MRAPIKLICNGDDCNAEITHDNCCHAIILGIVYRFCCESHRTAFRRKFTQLQGRFKEPSPA